MELFEKVSSASAPAPSHALWLSQLLPLRPEKIKTSTIQYQRYVRTFKPSLGFVPQVWKPQSSLRICMRPSETKMSGKLSREAQFKRTSGLAYQLCFGSSFCKAEASRSAGIEFTSAIITLHVRLETSCKSNHGTIGKVIRKL